MNSTQKKEKKIWCSAADYENSPEFLATLEKEFPSGAQELSIKPGIERRKFLEIIGSSMALAGIMSTGCIRRPKEFIYPETHRPEDTLPGVSKFYSTTAPIGSNVLGLSVTSTDGRPTKIDGNHRHPMSNPVSHSKLGASNAFAQAEILNLYDSDRGQTCSSIKPSETVTKKFVLNALYTALQKSKDGDGISVLVESFASPTFYRLLTNLREKYPNITLAEHNTFYDQNSSDGATKFVGQNAKLSYNIDAADVIFALDSDFLGLEGNTVKNAREFSERRKQVDTNKSMNRLYSIESNLSVTGSNADHRYALASSQIPYVLVRLASELQKYGIPITQIPKLRHDIDFNARLSKWISAAAKDIAAHKNKALITIGEKQPSWVHTFALTINKSLGAFGKTLDIVKSATPKWLKKPEDLISSHQKKPIETLIIIGGNPAYGLPSNLNFKNITENAKKSFYLGYFFDETAKAASYYVPKTHFLESWGDVLTNDGTYSIRQPLISPLFEQCMSEYEFVSSLIDEKPQSDYQLVRENCKKFVGNIDQNSTEINSSFENAWRSYLSTGVVSQKNLVLKDFSNSDLNFISESYYQYERGIGKTHTNSKSPRLEIVFSLSNTIYDGRYANNSWMQELPDPISKLVWDNALLLNPKTAKKIGTSGNPKPGSSTVDMVTVTYQDRTLSVPVWEVPGIAEGSAILSLGFGGQQGQVAKRAGFNTNLIRTTDVWFDTNVKIEKNGQTYSLVSTQEHGTMTGHASADIHRTPAVRSASLKEYIKNPNFVLKDEVLPKSEQKSFLFKFPKDPAQAKWARQQWGMTIDLNSCIGCNACTVACQAENNISVVGKEQVHISRVMHWIRLDRYFTGDFNDPELQTLFQPMNCQHCENAPCEAVCPVVATAHSPDGINEMTYNRCVGTRYCANNCPYKVRRFNFFNYSEENDKKNSLYAMQKNPNVTVRFRGVMEKCTYCVHKINIAKNKVEGSLVPNGSVQTACQSVCPTNAIEFGDIADPTTTVSELKALPRNYGILGELNTQPRTTYLAKIRNVNLEIG